MSEVDQRKQELFEYIMSVCKMGVLPDVKKLNIYINKFQIAVQESCKS